MFQKTFSPRAFGSGSGTVLNADSSWANVRGATTGDSVSTTNVAGNSRSNVGPTEWYIDRGFMSFDTSALPDDAIISAVTLQASITVIDGDNDGDDYVVIVESTQASATTLTTADFNNAGATAGSDTYDLTGGTGSVTFTFNATGRGWVNVAGNTLLAIREGHDMLNHQIADAGQDYGTLTSISLTVTYTSVIQCGGSFLFNFV